jgi:hypothetical protein
LTESTSSDNFLSTGSVTDRAMLGSIVESGIKRRGYNMRNNA